MLFIFGPSVFCCCFANKLINTNSTHLYIFIYISGGFYYYLHLGESQA